jgi:hypothetical protein
MTSLKVKYANEIAEAMAKSLGDEEFVNLFHKTASIEKEASPEYDEFVKKFKEYQGSPGPGGKENVRDKAEDALKRVKDAKEKATGEKLIKDWYNKEQQAGIKTTPKGQLAEDDCMSADCMEGMLAKDCCPECDKKECVCGKQAVAAEFALNHLVKLADTLDKQGFDVLANMVDEVTLKVAKKKEKSEKKDDKKEKKDDKKEKKDDKDEKKDEKDEKKDEKDEKKDNKKDKKDE